MAHPPARPTAAEIKLRFATANSVPTPSFITQKITARYKL